MTKVLYELQEVNGLCCILSPLPVVKEEEEEEEDYEHGGDRGGGFPPPCRLNTPYMYNTLVDRCVPLHHLYGVAALSSK